LRLTCS
jgi:hypothetical protein